MRRHLLRILLVAALAASPGLVRGQNRALQPTRIPIEVQQVSTRAGTIFSGRVISIAAARPASPDRVATVTVTVQVENAIRGVKPAQIYSFHEWAGLWSASPRYRVGQRLLLFLYAPSKLGLTSPVGGRSGVLPVDVKGRVLLPQQPRIPGLLLAPSARTQLTVKDVANSLRHMRED
jgi:hypothetical protein